MAFNQFPSKGGIPSGNTASRPSNPVIGDTYYNGQLEVLEIYNGTAWVAASAPPATPTIATPTDVGTGLAYTTGGSLTVVFTNGSGGGTPTQYNALTTTGGFSASSSSTTVTLTGLTPATAFTVYGNAQNNFGTTVNTVNAAPVTATTKPQAPTIGTATAGAGEVTVTWTLNSTGGKPLSAITITPFIGATAQTPVTAATTSSTTHTVTGLSNSTTYTFKVKTTNANGDSPDSAASNTATPALTFTGGTLVTSGGFNYRIFTSNGTLGVTGGTGNIDVLAIGGGGGGGFGGGGAGALVYSPALSVSTGNKAIVIGGGGTGNESAAATTTKGGNTTFDSTVVVAAGGGGGGRKTGDTGGNSNTGPGEAGGCGGGGGHPGSPITAEGGVANSALSTGTNIYGFNGGNGWDCCNGGGGGGTGQAGGNGDGDPGTGVNIGGNGKTNWLNASTSDTAAFLWAAQIGTNGSNALVSGLGSNPGTIYLGGGGGGAYGSPRGGYGGGGTGGVSGGNTSGITVGAANTGSGGGGGNTAGKAGGSGVLIVRYTA